MPISTCPGASPCGRIRAAQQCLLAPLQMSCPGKVAGILGTAGGSHYSAPPSAGPTWPYEGRFWIASPFSPEVRDVAKSRATCAGAKDGARWRDRELAGRATCSGSHAHIRSPWLHVNPNAARACLLHHEPAGDAAGAVSSRWRMQRLVPTITTLWQPLQYALRCAARPPATHLIRSIHDQILVLLYECHVRLAVSHPIAGLVLLGRRVLQTRLGVTFALHCQHKSHAWC
jgi:hypothetical protein